MIWWLRHGESTWNAARRMQWQTEHPPLTDRGRVQAATAAEQFADTGVTRILSSPAVRAQQTAEIIATRLGLSVETEPALIEKGFGESSADLAARIGALVARIGQDDTILAVTHGDTIMSAVEFLSHTRPPPTANCEALGVDPETGDVTVISALP